MIGVGTFGYPTLPPPNRTGGSPAYGSPVGGSPQRGLTGRRMGCNKREQPLLSKEGISPAVMVGPSALTSTAPTFPEYAAKAHAYPGVQRLEGIPTAVLEILKPALKGPIDVRDNREETMAISTPGLVTDRIPEFLQTLGPRPAHAPFKMITQKVESAANGRIDNAGFGRVQSKTRLGRPLLNHRQSKKGLRFRATQNNKSSSAGEFHPHALTEPDVNLSAHPALIVQPKRVLLDPRIPPKIG